MNDVQKKVQKFCEDYNEFRKPMTEMIKDIAALANVAYSGSKEKVFIRYHDPDLIKLEKFENGDWIDLRAAEDVALEAGEFRLISLGVSMKLPDGYEAHIVPRSSTFKKWGIIQTNHMGVIDNSYSGDNDIWMFPALALRNTVIKKNDRICQFRIVRKQPVIRFSEVDCLDGEDRGGFGSTGTN